MRRIFSFRNIFKVLAFIPYHLTHWTRVYNKKALKKFKGKPVVIVANHKSNYDIPVTFMNLPRELFFLAKPSLFKKRIPRWFFLGLNGYPVERGKDLALMKHSLGVLKQNKCLLIFPEGMRVFNPEDALAFRNGASLIAIKAGVPILPMVINRRAFPFRLTKIKFGEPISTEGLKDKKMSKEELTDFSQKVADIMAGMLVGFEKGEKREEWDTKPVHVVRGIIINESDEFRRLLVIKRVRDGKIYFTLPGGHTEDGEKPRDTIIREIKEETGIDVVPNKILYKYEFNKKMQAFMVTPSRSGTKIVMDPQVEEYKDGPKPSGTYEPMWVSLYEIYNSDFDLRPRVVKEKLQSDLIKLGTKLVRSTKFLKD